MKRTLWLFLLALATSACGDSNTNTAAPQLIGVATCGDQTVLAAGQCVPDDGLGACGMGLVLVEGTCVATDALCTQGTTFDVVTMRCSAEVTCGPGTAAVDGLCRPLAESVDDPSALREDERLQNDPIFGGTPQDLTLPDFGDSVRLLGTLSPPADFNADGITDQDRDVYRVRAAAGTYLRIQTARAIRGSFGFRVTGPHGFVRQSPGFQAEGDRKVYLPYDGAYDITVLPQAQVIELGAGPSGSVLDTYLLVVENLGDFDVGGAVPIDVEESLKVVPGEYEEISNNLYRLRIQGDHLARFSLSPEDEVVEPIFVLLDDAGNPRGEFDRGDTAALLSKAQGDPLVLIDYVRMNGRAGYDVNTEEVELKGVRGTLSAAQRVSSDASVDLAPGRDVFYSIEVDLGPDTQGLVVSARAQLTDPSASVRLEAFDPNNAPIASSELNPGRFFASESGTYVVRVVNSEMETRERVTGLELTAFAPLDLGEISAARPAVEQTMTLSIERPTFFTFTATGGSSVAPSFTSSAEEFVSMTLFTPRFFAQASRTGVRSANLGIQPIRPEGRRVGIIANLSFAEISGTLSLTSAPGPEPEREPNDRRAIAPPLDTFPAIRTGRVGGGDVDYYKITPSEAVGLELRAMPIAGRGALEVQVQHEDGSVFERGEPSGSESGTAAVLAPGRTYFVRVSAQGAPLDYGFVAEEVDFGGTPEVEPNEDPSTATALFATGAPASFVGVGTIESFGDDDTFAIDLAADTFLHVEVEPLRIDLAGSTDDLFVTIAGPDEVPLMRDAPFVLLPSGKSTVTVSTLRDLNRGSGYRVTVREVTFEDLGALGTGRVIERDGFTPIRRRLQFYRLTLEPELHRDETFVAGTSGAMYILDADGGEVFTPRTSETQFSFLSDPSFSSTTLSAGTYYIATEQSPEQPFRALFARLG
ncbi:MAG: hypothetical protein AAGI01_10740, partial [Myxococcota bacterium]